MAGAVGASLAVGQFDVKAARPLGATAGVAVVELPAAGPH